MIYRLWPAVFAWALFLGISCTPPAAAPQSNEPPAASTAPAEPLGVVQTFTSPAGVTTARLSNQLTVIIKPVHTSPVVSVRAVVRAGSIYEKPLLGCGLSHLLEHLVAQDAAHDNSSAQAPSDEDNRVNAIGGQSNANTGNDLTNYFINASSERTRECIALIADWMARPSFTAQDFKREHGVVQRELELGSDAPRRMLGNAHEQNVFGPHPAGVPVIGFAKPLSQLTWKDIRSYHARMYVPQNMVFVVVGDVEVAPTLNDICQQFAGFQAGRSPDLTLPEVAPLAGVKRSTLENPEVAEAIESISFITIPMVHEDLYALDTLSYILTQGPSSRLEESVLRRQKLLTEVSSASWTPSWGKGHFQITFSAEAEKADAAEKAILDELKLIADKGVSDAEVARAKRQKIADHVNSQQTVDDISAMLGADYLATGDAEFTALYTRRIGAVTPQQVQQAAKKYFDFNAMAITRMQPEAKSSAAGGVATPAGGEPAARMVTLENGLRVILRPTRSVGLVAMTMVTEGGVLLETEKTNGMGTLMTKLSTNGAGKLSATEISAFFDQAGGAISGSCATNSFLWQATVLEDSFPRALEIFADVVQRPTYAEGELAIARPGLLKAIERLDEELIGEAFLLARKGYFKDSPYRLQAAGKADVIGSATVEQIARYHKHNVLAGSSVLAIYGNFDEPNTAARLQSLFGALPAGKAKLNLPASSPPAKDALEVVKTQKQGAAIVMYAPAMKITDVADRLPMNVLDTIISGWDLPSGWLHNELRGKELVYVVHALVWTGAAPGGFVAYAGCQPQNAPQVLAIMRKDLDRAAAYTPTQAEIDRAVNTIITTEQLDNQSMLTLSQTVAVSEMFGMGYDYVQKLPAAYKKVTPADVQRVARKYLGRGYYVLVTTPKDELLAGKKDAATGKQ